MLPCHFPFSLPTSPAPPPGYPQSLKAASPPRAPPLPAHWPPGAVPSLPKGQSSAKFSDKGEKKTLLSLSVSPLIPLLMGPRVFWKIVPLTSVQPSHLSLGKHESLRQVCVRWGRGESTSACERVRVNKRACAYVSERVYGGGRGSSGWKLSSIPHFFPHLLTLPHQLVQTGSCRLEAPPDCSGPIGPVCFQLTSSQGLCY